LPYIKQNCQATCICCCRTCNFAESRRSLLWRSRYGANLFRVGADVASQKWDSLHFW